MANEPAIVPDTGIESAIRQIRGQKVMLDSDLARIYGVPTKQLNQQVRRNLNRFPNDFAFQLTRQELAFLRSQNVTSSSYGGRRYLPYAFTERGAIMLASVLNSSIAIEASVRVVRAFIHLREMLASNKELARKFAELERRLDGHDEAIKNLFDAIRRLLDPETEVTCRREIGFHVKDEGRINTAKAKKVR